VPLEIPTLASHPYKTREIYTPELVEFLKKYEFKSLLPKSSQTEKKMLKDFGLEITEILSDEQLKKIESILLSASSL